MTTKIFLEKADSGELEGDILRTRGDVERVSSINRSVYGSHKIYWALSTSDCSYSLKSPAPKLRRYKKIITTCSTEVRHLWMSGRDIDEAIQIFPGL